jgi:hypothetical protein
MNREEALSILNSKLDQYRQMSYAELSAMVGGEECQEAVGPSGVEYQIEIQVMWDHRPNGDIRVLGAIDDGGLRAFVPLSSDLLVKPVGDDSHDET